MSQVVCFPRLYIFILICLVIFVSYTFCCKYQEEVSKSTTNYFSRSELKQKFQELQDALEQKCLVNLNSKTNFLNGNRVLNKIINPLESPERIYPGGRLNVSKYDDYQLVGFIFSASNERFPLYGRQKYQGRSDKWEYYIIDESRNRLKIPFKSLNENELYTGDSVEIPSLPGTFQANIYEYESIRYNPNI